jgi:hypothetical protein
MKAFVVRASDRGFVVSVTALAQPVELARPSSTTSHDLAILGCDAGREWMLDSACGPKCCLRDRSLRWLCW